MTIKTIISAFAVAGLAVTGLCEVSSANIVGYLSNSINFKNNLGASPFLQIGVGEGMSVDIQAIKPTFAKGVAWRSGSLQLKTLKASGVINDTFYYLTASDAYEVDEIEEEGWFNEDMDTRLVDDAAVIFNEGEGFILYSNLGDGEVTITYAGEVCKGATTYEVGFKNNMQGNVTPIKIEIKDIIAGDMLDKDNVPVLSEGYRSGQIQLKTWKANSVINDTYYYLNASDAYEVDEIEKEGWFNEDMDTRLVDDAKVEFKAGEGFVVYANIDAAYIQIPAAL